MQKSRLTRATQGDRITVQQKLEEDEFCSKIIQLLTSSPLRPMLYREIKKIGQSSFFDTEEMSYFTENSRMSKLHRHFSNVRLCELFLLLDKGFNITQLSERFKRNRKDKDLRSSVRDWLKKLEELQLVQKSSLARYSSIYEKNCETKDKAIQLLNYVCKMKLSTLKRGEVENLKNIASNSDNGA